MLWYHGKQLIACLQQVSLDYQFEKLNKLAGNDEKLKIEILKESIFKNWQGVFHLKDDFDKSKISAMEQNYLDWKIAEEQNGNK